MGSRLGSFLRVVGATLSPQAHQAQSRQFEAEQADVRLQESEQRAQAQRTEDTNLKIALGDISAKMAFLQKLGVNDPRAMKIVEGMKRTAQNVPEKFRRAVVSSVGDELALIGGINTEKGKARTVMFNGERIAAVENTQGQLVDPVSKQILKGATIAPTRAETAGADGFTKKTESTIQDNLIKKQLATDRLQVIKDGFKPEFTEAGTKIATRFTAFVEGLGLPTSKTSRKKLAEFTDFSRNSLANINQHIRDRTGAVMNATEVPRLMGEMPNIGTGIFDGDSATQFTSKLKGVMASLDAAEDRLLFVQANGLTPDRSENGKTVSSSGLPLSDFTNLPPRPQQFDKDGWNKMKPSDRRRLVKLMNQGKQ